MPEPINERTWWKHDAPSIAAARAQAHILRAGRAIAGSIQPVLRLLAAIWKAR